MFASFFSHHSNFTLRLYAGLKKKIFCKKRSPKHPPSPRDAVPVMVINFERTVLLLLLGQYNKEPYPSVQKSRQPNNCILKENALYSKKTTKLQNTTYVQSPNVFPFPTSHRNYRFI